MLTRHDKSDPQPGTPGKSLQAYPTPNRRDLIVTEDVPIKASHYEPLPIGTYHPDNDRTNLGLRLVWQGPVKGMDPTKQVRRIYATDRTAESTWNYAIKYSADDANYPIYIRSYLARRATFTPATRNQPLKEVITINVGAVGANYTSATVVVVNNAGTGGTGCTARAIIYKGTIVGVEIVTVGSGYNTAPAISFTDSGGGSGATATAAIQPVAAVLVKEDTDDLPQDDPLHSAYLRVIRVYETLPGPPLPTESNTNGAYEQIPEEYRQNDDIDEIVTRVAPGTAADTATGLTTGSILSSIVKAISKTVSERTNRYLVAGTRPVFNGKETNAFRQLATKVRQLVSSSSATPTALRKVTVRDLGNGLKEEEVTDDPSLFDGHSITVTKPNPIPERFRASEATTTDIIRSAATSISTPTLSATEFRKTVEREDAFIVRTTVESLDVGALPTLYGQDVDQTTGVLLPYSERVVASGATLGAANTTVTPLSDDWDLSRTTDITALETAFAAYKQVFPGRANINLPDVLGSFDIIEEASAGDANDDIAGMGYWSGHGSYSIPSNAQAETEQTVTFKVLEHIIPTYGNNKPTTRAIFLMKSPITSAALLSKITSVLGLSVSAWPDFNPEPATVIITGRSLSLMVKATYHIQDGGSDDGSEHAESGGIGYSIKKGTQITTLRLPPTIHGGSGSGGSGLGGGWSFIPDPIIITATAEGGGFGLRYLGDQVSTLEADPPEATIEYEGLNATSGATLIPGSGVHLYDDSMSPYQLGWLMVHVEVFNFADL